MISVRLFQFVGSLMFSGLILLKLASFPTQDLSLSSFWIVPGLIGLGIFLIKKEFYANGIGVLLGTIISILIVIANAS